LPDFSVFCVSVRRKLMVVDHLEYVVSDPGPNLVQVKLLQTDSLFLRILPLLSVELLPLLQRQKLLVFPLSKHIFLLKLAFQIRVLSFFLEQ